MKFRNPWFAVSRKLNRDPEVWELTDQFGDRSIRIWLELLALANQSANRLVWTKQWLLMIANTTRHRTGRTTEVIQWMLGRGWIAEIPPSETELELSSNSVLTQLERVLLIPNLQQYQKVTTPKNKTKQKEDKYTDKDEELAPKIYAKSEQKKMSAPLDPKFEEFWLAYPRKSSKGQAEKAWHRDVNPDTQLFSQIMVKLEDAKKSEQWTKDGGQFIPYPATWLRAKGWLDDFTPMKKVRGLVQ
jgi:hypothetical protein